MKTKKVLHITNWYPNKWDTLDGIFVKNQFKVFLEITDSKLVHVQVREGNKLFEFKNIKYSDNEEGFYILTKIKKGKIIEILTSLLLIYVLFKKKYKHYDVLHFHIAYPLLVHYHLWKKFIKKPVILSEHWSAYHFNFYMPKESKKLNPIRRIFKQNIPLITVSKALLKDIENFCNCEIKKYEIIPNVINDIFFERKNIKKQENIPVFFIVNQWTKIKNPFNMLKAFSKLKEEGIEFKLKIGGYGEIYPEIAEFVKTNNLIANVTMLGKMTPEQILLELYTSDAYLLSSNYETFSMICAEALLCGTPILGRKIDAVSEYCDKKNSVLFESNDVNDWVKNIKLFIHQLQNNYFDKEYIFKKADEYFSKSNIKSKYKAFIERL